MCQDDDYKPVDGMQRQKICINLLYGLYVVLHSAMGRNEKSLRVYFHHSRDCFVQATSVLAFIPLRCEFGECGRCIPKNNGVAENLQGFDIQIHTSPESRCLSHEATLQCLW